MSDFSAIGNPDGLPTEDTVETPAPAVTDTAPTTEAPEIAPPPKRIIARCEKHGIIADNVQVLVMQLHGHRIGIPCPHCLEEAFKSLDIRQLTYDVVA